MKTNSQPDSPEVEEILTRYFEQAIYLAIGQKTTITDPRNGGVGKMINFYATKEAKKAQRAIQEYYTNKFMEIVGERPEMQEGFEFPCRFCRFDPDKLLKRIKLL